MSDSSDSGTMAKKSARRTAKSAARRRVAAVRAGISQGVISRPGPLPRARLGRSELNETLGFKLREAWVSMERYFVECFREEGITPPLYAILILVETNPGCLTSEICREVAISPTNIIPYVDGLIERGLLSREYSVKDRRHKHLSLTADGQAYLQRLRSLHQGLTDHFTAKLGKKNMDKLIELLALMSAEE
jgi:MarR family transcriptional regulator, organic hydroperoxide resistance regulator